MILDLSARLSMLSKRITQKKSKIDYSSKIIKLSRGDMVSSIVMSQKHC